MKVTRWHRLWLGLATGLQGPPRAYSQAGGRRDRPSTYGFLAILDSHSADARPTIHRGSTTRSSTTRRPTTRPRRPDCDTHAVSASSNLRLGHARGRAAAARAGAQAQAARQGHRHVCDTAERRHGASGGHRVRCRERGCVWHARGLGHSRPLGSQLLEPNQDGQDVQGLPSHARVQSRPSRRHKGRIRAGRLLQAGCHPARRVRVRVLGLGRRGARCPSFAL